MPALHFKSEVRLNTRKRLVFAVKFLKAKKNKPFNRLIQALMEFLRHKSFDRLIKFEKGKVTNRIAMIHK